MSAKRFAHLVLRDWTILSDSVRRITRLGSRSGGPTVSDRILTAPNLITLVRVAVVTLSLSLIVAERDWLTAFWCLWFAAILDGLDGYVARRFNQVSRFGTFLDPVVDRLAMVAIVAVLTFTHILSVWLFAATMFRDLVLALLAIASAYRRRQIIVSVTGKFATISLFLGIPLFLLNKASRGSDSWINSVALGLTVLGLILYYVSLIQYARTVLATPKITLVTPMPDTQDQQSGRRSPTSPRTDPMNDQRLWS